jgi:hypothetical protein
MQYLGPRRTAPREKKERESTNEPRKEIRKRFPRQSHTERKSGCMFPMYHQPFLALLCLRLEEAVEPRVVAETAGVVGELLSKGTMARTKQVVLQGAT